MKKGGGKQKGSRFELEIAKLLSEWYGKEKSFNRAPSSGMWSTVHDSNKVPGDIVCPDDFPFVIECKKREGFKFHKLFDEDYKDIREWWDQALESATRAGKKPLLIIGKNNRDTLVYLRNEDLPFMSFGNGVGIFMINNVLVMRLVDFLSKWKQQGKPEWR
jgi:Holliday junction resolvase